MVDLRPSPRGLRLRAEMLDFMEMEVIPAESELMGHRQEADVDRAVPQVILPLIASARRRGLWNLFLPSESGLSQLDYAGIAEISGWSLDLAPAAINGQAPDTGNMELLHLFGTPDQKARWLNPLLDASIRSAFAMSEPDVASSDASNIETEIVLDRDEWVINGRKWWVSGAADPRCELIIVMGKTDPAAARHRQQSMILVPRHTAGLTVLRDLPVFGRYDHHGHCEILLENVRVPIDHTLGQVGEGFAVAQARLGPGRIHHCMRALGAAERALDLLVTRAQQRTAFGGALLDQGSIQRDIAVSRIEIDQARLICLRAARFVDVAGNHAAAIEVAKAKAIVPTTALRVIDRAIQVHGGAGVSDDVPLAAMYGWHRAMRIFDGPDEVHLRSIARAETRSSRGISVLR